jgi:Cu2+-exporting ATPase
MSCCCAVGPEIGVAARSSVNDEVRLASRVLDAGRRQTDLSVPTIHCGACIRAIEATLGRLPGVEHTRVNLSTKRVAVRWLGDKPPPLIETLQTIGYEAHLCDPYADGKDSALAELTRALAVAGFAASNIMLLSVAIWSGAEPATRDLFHWLSALIALPALAYSGRVFFRSAWNAVRHGRTNMDVPISIGVLLAFGLSLHETIVHGPHAYFDAATMLLFFLLIGRTLDHVMRERARVAVKGLARLAPRGALVIEADGTQAYRPLDEIRPGMSILLAAGERVPVDGCVSKGRSEIDYSLVTGESLPQPAGEGTPLQAGTLNLTGPLTITATAAARDSFLAEMVRLMEAAESGRSQYRRIADRAAQLYAPVVHLTALVTFVGWLIAAGDIHRAITVAIAVLIITCPCALGLAVPMVQVAAARRLFESGIMIKDGGALERLAEVDTVMFDKTGTLTLGRPRFAGVDVIDAEILNLAAAIGSHSRHPYSQALAAMDQAGKAPVFDDVCEYPGYGLEARAGETIYRLGRPDWALADPTSGGPETADVVLTENGRGRAAFRLEDRLRPGARAAMRMLSAEGLSVEILSGDSEDVVRKIAAVLDIPYAARVSPAGKVDRIASAAAAGAKVLMVGDGLNDTPALAKAHASMAPAAAADVGRNAADMVFLRENLMAVPQAIVIARRAGRLVRQNLALAIVYNAVAVPFAVAGEVTPLVAAIAMSASSILVVANSLRLRALDRVAAVAGQSRTPVTTVTAGSSP